jgi:acetyltransferase-like isoleucine patch superfamily enzyme
MSAMGRVMAAWPWTFLALLAASAWRAWWSVPLVLYLLPPLLHRLHGAVFPLREGAHALVGKGYVPWWGSHQLQLPFIAFPALEALLRVLGLYSAWLRLWGARVGRGVYWTPLVEITDRALLEIGDGVVVGHKCGFYAHAIRPARGTLYLYARRIRVGAGAFLGAGSGFGPGAVVAAGAYLPLRTEVYPGRTEKGADGGAGGRPPRNAPPEVGA